MATDSKKRGIGRALKAGVMVTSIATPTLLSQTTNTSSAFLGWFGNSKNTNTVQTTAESSGTISKFVTTCFLVKSAKDILIQKMYAEKLGVMHTLVDVACYGRRVYNTRYGSNSSSWYALMGYSLIENFLINNIVYPLANTIDNALNLNFTIN